MVYDYREAMMNDIKTAIKDEYENFDEFEDREDLFNDMHDKFWDYDEITGNGNGGYTYDTCAEDCLKGNWDLVQNAMSEFGMPDNFDRINGTFFDVSVRCYLLGEVINEVLDDLI